MYLRRFTIENIRAVRRFELDFERGREPGWHVVLGPNGAGKSSVIRSFALLMMGEKESYASRQVFRHWISETAASATISASITRDEDFDSLGKGGRPPKKAITPTVTLSRDAWESFSDDISPEFSGDYVKSTIWGGGAGWFCASFGPFRRFTGGDRIYDRLFVSNRKLAPHLTALGEDVALTEALDWLRTLHVSRLQAERSGEGDEANAVITLVTDFLNASGFLPFDAKIVDISNQHVFVEDGFGSIVQLEQLSDGYRSALSLVLELLRQMFLHFGTEKVISAYDAECGSIQVPGVVAIDEVDVHLHPTWQRDIGRWLTKQFPRLQFIVTTHSPIVCRAIVDETGEIQGSVWRLPAPGVKDDPRAGRVVGPDLEQLAYGDVLDAFSTELFGANVSESAAGAAKQERLAELNVKALEQGLSEDEKAEQQALRAAFPSLAGHLG